MARVKTEEKRQEIVRVAAGLFEEQGFDRTSMSQISQELGGSKATLYGYFNSKEELLQAVLTYDVTVEADRLMNQFLDSNDIRDGLISLGEAYMARRLSSMPIANVRMVANLPKESTVGKEFFETVLRPAWQRLANRFQTLMEKGVLRQADPWVAAMQWKGLCEWDMFEKRLLGAIQQGDPAEIKKASVLAADAFLTLYGNGNKKVEPARQRKSAKGAVPKSPAG